MTPEMFAKHGPWAVVALMTVGYAFMGRYIVKMHGERKDERKEQREDERVMIDTMLAVKVAVVELRAEVKRLADRLTA